MSKTPSFKKTPPKPCTFIGKLLDMMQNNPHNLYWSKDGEQLIINDEEQVERRVLPAYFSHQNFASFVRQLNMYGFCKKEKRDSFFKFTHKIFKKNNDHNYHLITRKVKSKIPKIPSSKFLESHQKVLETIKTKSGLDDSAQELTLTLLQYKDNIQDVLKRLKYQFDKLGVELRDVRSKDVLHTYEILEKECYGGLVRYLAEGKKLDEIIEKEISFMGNGTNKDSNKKEEQKGQHDQDHDQCSLEDQLEEFQESQKCNSENQISQRFQMEEEELSAFNQFQLREDK